MKDERVLLVITPDMDEEQVRAAVPPGEVADADLHIVVPAIAKSAVSYWFSDDQGIEHAREAAKSACDLLCSEAGQAEAHVGDSDPQLAVQDAIAEYVPDRIIVVHGAEHHGFREAKLDDLEARIGRHVEQRLMAA